jgi:gas vesicle protein
MSRNGHTTLRDIAILASGIGIGSCIALLLAPGSGEDIRYAISHGYRKTVKKIGRRTDELRDRAEDLLDHAHELGERGSRLLQLSRRRQSERRWA